MGINYNNENELFKKGSVLISAEMEEEKTIERWVCSRFGVKFEIKLGFLEISHFLKRFLKEHIESI